jgi:phosphoribosyl-AMP cyclohydrolase
MIPGLKYNEQGLIPAIIQDVKDNEVLMLGYMNEESIKKTIETGRTCFWSRSRQEFWTKGETSGNVQLVKEVLYDCDGDTLLVKVDQVGKGACHTGNRTCFFRKIE